MVTTNDARVAETIRALRNCGQREKNVHELEPFNHRLDNLQAAILRVKLNYLEQWLELRRQWAALYKTLLEDVDLKIQAEPPGYRHVYHLFVIRSTKRDALQVHLKNQGIGAAIHYPIPVHLQPFYNKNSGDARGRFPVAERVCNEILSLPMFPELKQEQVEIVASSIKEFVRETSPSMELHAATD